MERREDTTTEEADWARRLRDLRRLLGWSQRAAAKELGVTPGAVSQWESGHRTIPGPVRRLVELYERNLGPDGAAGGNRLARLTRTLRMSKTAASVAGRLAGSSLRGLVASNAHATQLKRATQLAIAQQLTATLGGLKGLLMKAGQMVSYLDFAVPEHMQEVLRELQDTSVPADEAAIVRVFEQELGAGPRQLFAEWEPRPIAAASIGQVHRARLRDGTPVAVKVQYPGIAEAVEGDLKNLRVLDAVGGLLFRGGPDGNALLEELRERVLEECDYRHEARNQETMRRLHAGTPHVVIPRVHPDFSTQRVLTMDWVEGQRFHDFARTADQRSRDHAGEVIFTFTARGINRHRVFNADPHPGNFLFLPQGEVAFLDFGCVKHFPRDFMRTLAGYDLAVLDGRREESDRLLLELGFVEDRATFDFDYHYRIVREIYEPWTAEPRFRFNRQYVERNWRNMVVENPNRSWLHMPRDALFLNRLQFGLHSVLAELRAEADWKAILRRHLVDGVGAGSEADAK